MESGSKKEEASSQSIIPRAPIDDHLSVYFLHHSDNPGSVLVSQLLVGDNYPAWSQAMKIAFSVKNKIGFIDGSIPKPISDDERMVNSWVRNNNMVVLWLMNSVSREICSSISFGDTTADIWKDLKERFQQSNGPRIFQLRRDLANAKQGQDSVPTFFTKSKEIWEELNEFRPSCSRKSCIDFHNGEYAMFLMGLNDSYTVIHGQFLLMDPLPSINKIFALVLQEEKQRSMGSDSASDNQGSTMAMAIKEEGAQKKFFKRDRSFCTHCKIPGHTIDKCYKVHEYPPGMSQRFRGQANALEVNHEDHNSMLRNLSTQQCHKIIEVLSNQLTQSNERPSLKLGAQSNKMENLQGQNHQ